MDRESNTLAALVTLVRIFLGTTPPVQRPQAYAAEQLTGLALKLGLAPVLHQNSATSMFSESVEDAFTRACLRTFARNVKLTEAMVRVYRKLREAGLAVIPFKGGVLSQQLYGGIGFRQSVDIDLMIRRAEIVRALAILRELGYKSSLSEAQEAQVIRRAFSIELINAHNGVMIDLQWDIANGYCKAPFSEKELFQSTRPMQIDAVSIEAFDEAMTLYLVCVHGAKSAWCELKSLLDLAMIMKKGSSELWLRTTALMQRQGTLAMLTTGCLLVKALLGVKVPTVLTQYVDRPAVLLAEEIRAFWRNRTDGLERPSAWQRFRWDLRFRKGWTEKARYVLFRMRPTKSDFIRHRDGFCFAFGARVLRILGNKRISQ